jgi:hypothetical protein
MSARGAMRAAFALLLAAAAPAGAQVIGERPAPPFPDPAKFSRGFFAEGDLGAAFFLGKMGEVAPPGPHFGLRIGYDLFRWLAAYAHVSGVTVDADVPAPYDHQSFQVFVYTAEVRAQLQLRRIGLYAAAGGGVAQLSNNLLDVAGVAQHHRLSGTVAGGLGFDFHTLNRHYSVGLAADYLWLPQWSESHAISVAAYLRYTR